MSTTEKPRWRRNLKRALWWLAIAAAGLLGLVVIVAIGLRLYYSDERLRRMAQELVAERTGAEVEIGALEISLLSGIELGELRIGPLPGFVHDTVTFERLALHWSAFDLLFLDVTIDELALEGVDFTLEENESAGRNIDALILGLAGPPAEPEEPEPEPEQPVEEPGPLQQPSLPVAVRLERLAIGINSVRIDQPELDLTIDRIGLTGQFEGEGSAMDLELWVGLGEREPDGATSVLTVSGAGLPGNVRVEQRFGVAVASTGFGDIQVQLDWLADGEVTGDEPLPPVQVTAGITLGTDLLAQSAELSRFEVGVGELTRVEVAAKVRDLLEAPHVHVSTLELSSNLGELTPLAAAFVEGLVADGELYLSAEPFDVAADPSALSGTNATLALLLSDINVEMAGVRVVDVELGTQVITEDGIANVQLEGNLPYALAAGQTIRNLDLQLSAVAPIAPWLGGPTAGSLDAELDIRVRSAGGAAGRGQGLSLNVEAEAPVALLLAGRASEPIAAEVRLDVGSANAAGTRAKQVRLELDARAWDFAGERIEAVLTTTVATVISAVGEDTVRLDNTSLEIDLGRRGQRFDVRRLLLSTTEALELEGRGVISDAFTTRPSFDNLSLRLSLIDLERVLSLVPASKRPELSARGRADLRVAIHGTLPLRDLTRRAQLPAVDATDMGAQLQAYADYLNRWEGAFRQGMPFTTSVDLSLIDLDLEAPGVELGGFGLDFGVAIEKHGPRTSLVVIADQIKPLGASDLRTDIELSFQDGSFALALSGAVGSLAAENMRRAITDVTTDLSLRYRLGGDLLLDTLAFKAPEPGLHLEASGVLSKPLRFVLARGWEKPGLPGLTAALRWKTGIHFGDELRAIVIDGPEVSGGASLAGNVRAEEGAIAFDGMLEFEHFCSNDDAKGTRLDDLSGGIPVDIEVSFDPRDDATVLRRNLDVGSGVLALVTSKDDIRKRPARPAYYERLRPYRQQHGLTFRSFRGGNIDVEDFELTGRVTEGMLLVDRLGMHILGGDVDGNMALQIGRDASLRTDIAVKVSNLDASYFKALDVEPGADAELSANMQLGFMAAPTGRDLTVDMNVTKIGSDTLDRFLLLLDGGDEDGPMSDIRGYLGLVVLKGVKAWVRFENLNLDLDAAPFLRIPTTTIGYPNLDREILRRFSLTGFLDAFAQSQIDTLVAPMLGWKDAS